ncbi:MAG: hypothetical protein COA74_06980 [Gammaproteobacteria bacterium]|nr:MAG: hypothetical protein COA74_06980 [Gammaproteobacteria bacterium]
MSKDEIKDEKGAAVKFPPPLVFLLMMLAAYGFHNFFPMTLDVLPFRFYLGISMVTFGAVIIIISFFTFRHAKTRIEPWKPTSNIISTGIFSYSRNPIYLAFCFISLGIGVSLNSFWISLSFIPSIVVVFFIAIKKEELYLTNKFGDDYLEYKAKVRRWF